MARRSADCMSGMGALLSGRDVTLRDETVAFVISALPRVNRAHGLKQDCRNEVFKVNNVAGNFCSANLTVGVLFPRSPALRAGTIFLVRHRSIKIAFIRSLATPPRADRDLQGSQDRNDAPFPGTDRAS